MWRSPAGSRAPPSIRCAWPSSCAVPIKRTAARSPTLSIWRTTVIPK